MKDLHEKMRADLEGLKASIGELNTCSMLAAPEIAKAAVAQIHNILKIQEARLEALELSLDELLAAIQTAIRGALDAQK